MVRILLRKWKWKSRVTSDDHEDSVVVQIKGTGGKYEWVLEVIHKYKVLKKIEKHTNSSSEKWCRQHAV
jgi:hypothetical protein